MSELEECETPFLRASSGARAVPDWLARPQGYEPLRDRDSFIQKSVLSVTSVLRHFRLDDGRAARFSPSAPTKLFVGLAVILLTSLARNYFFTMVVLAGVLVRLCLMSTAQLKRVCAVAFGAAGVTALVMAPAVLIGQSHSMLLIATKVFVSVGVAMSVALTTPFNELTGALRLARVPNLIIMTIDLALKNIVRLGSTALEVLTALRLRSVGRNRDKATSVGGVGGVLLLKSQEAARVTFDAMSCRGFEGEYVVPKGSGPRAADAAWLGALALLAALFFHLQGLVA